MMGILLLVIALITIILIVLAIIYKHGEYVIASICLGFVISVGTMIIASALNSIVHSEYITEVYLTPSANHTTSIGFDAFYQDEKLVTINGYYAEEGMGWATFGGYKYHNETLLIQISEGYQFEYRDNNPHNQIVITTTKDK